MKRKIENVLKNILSLNVKTVFNLFLVINSIINNLAAIILNVFFVYEIVLRVVIFIYYIKNIMYFLYLNQKKKILTNSILYLYGNLNVFYKIAIRPFNYICLYTLFDFVVLDFKNLNAYLEYKLHFVERIFVYISNLVEYEKENTNFKFNKKSKLNNINFVLKEYNLTKLYLFLSYNYSNNYNKISYIFGNNIFNLNFFTFLIDLEILNLNNILNLEVKKIADFFIAYIYNKIEPLLFSVYVGYYRTLTYSIIYFYNLYIILQFSFFFKQYQYIYKELNKRFNQETLEWDLFKFEVYCVINLYIYNYIIITVNNIVNVVNDIKLMAQTLYTEDFTIFDCVKYYLFSNVVLLTNSNNALVFENISDVIYYIKEELKKILFSFYYHCLNSFSYFLNPYLQFYALLCAFQLLIFILNRAFYNLINFTSLYINFTKEFYEFIVYFLELFYYFVSSSFFSEHILFLILIEFFLEIFGLSINSIEFVISLIFIIVSSIISSQFLDFFENYNIELLLETFSLFYFCFSFLYEQQKLLLTFLTSKLKSFLTLRYLVKYTSKLYNMNKENIKVIILLEKIKKIKIK